VDHFKARQVPLAFTIELRDKGEFGFLAPPTLIQPTKEDMLASLQVLVAEVLKLDKDGDYDDEV